MAIDIEEYIPDIEENIPDIAAKYIPLHRAIMSNNWEKAKRILEMDKDALTAKIDVDGHTPLHIAIRTRNNYFAMKLLEMIDPDSLLDLRCKSGCSTLHTAASVGNIEIVCELVQKNPRLLFINDKKGYFPIHKAIIRFHIDTFKLLLREGFKKIAISDHGYAPFKGKKGVQLLTNVILSGEFDIAYELIKKFNSMAQGTYGNISPLNTIASKSDAYLSGEQYNFYQRFLYSHIKIENSGIDYNEKPEINMTKSWRSYFYPVVPHINKLYQDKKKHTAAAMLLECICREVRTLTMESRIVKNYYVGFNLAVENDTPEAIEAIIRYFPQATATTYKGYGLCQNAIKNRSEKVYNIAVEHLGYDSLRTYTDKNENNNLLHLAGKLAPIHKLNEVSGAALQMQREFQWFKAVEKFVLPSVRENKNGDGEKPMTVFRKEHKDLRKDGEEWMKKTAESYTITTALIITIAFAAAITVPGGNNGDTGKAIFEKQASFIVFVVADAISFFTSSTSLLLFLSVLTARYREEDFLYGLPKRIILGLLMLFLSMTAMIVAFSATLYILFGQQKAWILISLAALTCMPIASFMKLQFPLLTELIHSTYGHTLQGKGALKKKSSKEKESSKELLDEIKCE